MDSKMSAAGLITIRNKAANLGSFISFILLCIFYSLIITFQDLYSCLGRAFHLFSYLIPNSWRSLYNAKPQHASPPPLPLSCNNIISREDVEIVMEKLGLVGDSPEEPLALNLCEIANMFETAEPSLVEAREAFGVFDVNKDGFIDAGELEKVMNLIGLTGFSEQECQRMIMAFDDNGDGKIDFGEFVKLMEDCSC